MRKILHPSYVLVAILGGVVVGTIFGVGLRVSFFSSVLWLVVAGILGFYGFSKPTRLTMILAIIAGMLIAFFRTSFELVGQNYVQQYENRTVKIVGVIKNDPDADETQTSFSLGRIRINDIETRGSIYVRMSQDDNLERGDEIELTGKISSGFGTYAGSIYRPQLKNVNKPKPSNVFLQIRNWFAEKVRKYIPEEESTLGLAYLLGMKTGLSNELMEVLRVVGLTHIVVASGTHLGIIVEFGKKFFKKISRFAGLFFSLILVFCFGSMVGWTASITRAAIVTGLALLAWYCGRKFEAWRLILIAMAATLIVNPMYLVDLGWLLSFGAFIGIMVLGSEITRIFYGKKKPNKIVEIIITTIAATLMCTPILLYYFGTISLISLVANLLILPTIPIIMGLTFTTGVTSFLPIVPNIIGKITTFALDYHLVVMRFFSKQKMFLIEIKAGNPWVFLLYIIICVPVLIRLTKKFHQKDESLRSR